MSTVFSFFLSCSTFLWCVCILPRVSLAHISGNETDRVALLAFKSQITQDPFGVMSSWNDSIHFCYWEGVKCSHRHQRVRFLNLSSKLLVGSISPHVGNLSFLSRLALYNNSFGGEIPPQLGHLFRLESLSLHNNLFHGELPINISLCSNLTELFLYKNHLVGTIPIELGSLPKLEVLNLGSNMLTGEIPSSLGNLTYLQMLALDENNLSGSIPSALGQLKALKVLILGENSLYGMIPSSFYNLSNIETLDVASNHRLTGILPTEIGINLPNLVEFLIGSNNFSGPLPASLFNASGLQSVDVGGNHFTGTVPMTVGNLKDLKFLGLEKNDLGSDRFRDLDFIAPLGNCSKLEEFSIAANQFGGMLPSSIGNFSNQLTDLLLGGNALFGNIPSEIGNLQNLIALGLEVNYFTGIIPMSFGKLSKLQILSISQNQLSGHLPNFLCNMSQLFNLQLSFNTLEGSISSAICNHNLQYLYLSDNNFAGDIPEQIGLLSPLILLDLSTNSLHGSIPSQVGSLKNLIFFNISENKISGEIPFALGSCVSMQTLDLSANSFQGSFPSSLESLKDLQYLDISHNNISGKIPKELEKSSIFRYLNLSFNDFEGQVPTEGIFQNDSAFSVFGNHKICGGIPKLGLPKCRMPTSKKKGTHLTLKVTLGVLTLAFVLFIMGLFLVVYLRKKTKRKIVFQQSFRNLKWVSYNDLQKATNGFSAANLIGLGGYGSVYKGLLNESEGHIAVKVFNLVERHAIKTFLVECEVLRQVRHRNILKILTVCSSVDMNGNDFKALVFDFVPNGSLESWLHPHLDGQHERRPLNINERLNISIDIASALEYLHNYWDKPVVHCDLKPSNVLLGDDLTAQVSDFGFARFLPKKKSTSASNKGGSSSIAVRGTIGYIPPEYGMGAKVSIQGDIYSYGILLLEIFTGKRPIDHMFKDGLTLHGFCKRALPHQVMDIIDLCMLPETNHSTKASDSLDRMTECLSSVIRIGVACSLDLATERMDIKTILKELHAIKETCIQVGSLE